jgi:hypothetical protein
VAKRAAPTQVRTAASVTATATATTWAPYFWTARRTRLTGVDRISSSVPDAASPASVPVSATIEKNPNMIGRNPIARHEMNPGKVSTLTGGPSRPWNSAGRDSICAANSARSAAVAN